VTADGVQVAVRLTPKGGRDAVDGMAVLADGRAVLKARVRAAPEDGQANAALLALLSSTLDVPRSRAALISGQTARLKMIHVEGDAAALAGRLAELIQQRGPQ
jgi:uncharacterized protein